MRKASLLTGMAALLLVLAAGAALAVERNVIDCPNREGDSCVGTFGADDMRGTAKADEMAARAGNDILRGFRGGDDLSGDSGKDTLFGIQGADTLKGNTGPDLLYGQAGDDRLFGGRDGDPDEFYCGLGTDSAVVEVGDLVQTKAGGLEPVLATTVENDLELITTCERITIKLLQ